MRVFFGAPRLVGCGTLRFQARLPAFSMSFRTFSRPTKTGGGGTFSLFSKIQKPFDIERHR